MGLNRNLGQLTEVIKESSGRIGLGTTVPNYGLNVVSSDLTQSGIVSNRFIGIRKTTNTLPGYLGLLGGDNGDTAKILGYNSLGTQTFQIDSSSNPTYFNGGNVGIGTASPLSTLVVQRNTSGGRGGELSIVNASTAAVGNEASINFGLEPSTYDVNDCNFQIRASLNNVNGATDAVFSNWSGASFIETLRINSSGVLNLPIGQIKFPSSQNSSSDPNTLDDYEEGSWSPVLGGTGGGTAVMAGITAGRYTKVGNKVTATAQIQWTNITGTISGNVVISGLPFTALAGGSGGVRCCGSMGAISGGLGFPSGYGEWVYLIDPGFSSVYIIANSTTGAGYTHSPNVGGFGTVYALTVTYFTS